MTSLVRVEKDLPLYPSSLFNPFFGYSSDYHPPPPLKHTLIPRYLSAVASTESVSLGESASLINLHALSCSSAPPRSSQPSTLLQHLHPLHHHQHPTPLGEPCQSQAYKRGLDGSLGGQPAPLCSPAQWRLKLACGGRSVAVGHSRQPGSSAWPALYPLHHSLNCPLLPSTSPGSLPIIPRTPPTHLTSILPLLPLELKPFNPPHGAEKLGRRGRRLDASR